MNGLPQPAWAVCLAVLGTILAGCVLVHPDPQTISLGVLAVASNLVSGALGAFAGHITAQKDTTIPIANTPMQPGEPAKEN